MSNVLTIDSSTNAVAVACGSSDRDASSRCVEQRAFHSENILVVIDEILQERSLTMKDIDVIGVGVGPGLFTGLRVGISAAHAFAHTLDIPLVYFSSLELTAISFAGSHPVCGKVVVARDARRHELYSATYESALLPTTQCTIDTTTFSTRLNRIHEEALLTPEQFVEAVNVSEDTQVFLDDISRYEEFSQFTETSRSHIQPASIDARYMLDHVIEAAQAGIVADVFAPSALYIRKSDAELSWNIQESVS
ncbi:MAG TPA: tRNA (adenosine(37)-N6)-threonylcarbamoyltransferase complex dimerization subunit type 1 TsaB [Acidimicrobiia bacterium]|nr:tRNA (adenosine(37)-N6)-threonylcarbamoyltransferase complex dimerization subunit type 1 TsaB [Acidimicrobiia bacterium]